MAKFGFTNLFAVVLHVALMLVRLEAFLVNLPNCTYVGTPKLRCKHIKFIVDYHNDCRRALANGTLPGQPKAANMQKVVWDERLAAMASNWTKQMIFGHNPYRSDHRFVFGSVGENLFMTAGSNVNSRRMEWVRPLKAWFMEYKLYTYSPTVDDPATGHYTQMIWADIIRIGCGATLFIDQKNWLYKYYVCNYGPSGNWFGHFPYQEDTGLNNEINELLESGIELEAPIEKYNTSQLSCDYDQCSKEYGKCDDS